MEIMLGVNIAVEGISDERVIRQVLEYIGVPCGNVYGRQGKSDLLRRLGAYNRAAEFSPWLIVVDLDQDAQCGPDFVRTHLPTPSTGMCFRLAVRAIESWLLADAEQLAAFLRVSPAKIPADPDGERDPKVTLVNLARRSTKKDIREDMVPREGSGSKVGPGYVGRVIEFAQLWRPEVAAERSDSLRRCLVALETLKTWKPD